MDALCSQVDEGIERAKEADDALEGAADLRDALASKRFHARVFKDRKFHAKAHILEAREGPVNFGIVGSSNFTLPGLTENVELNLFTAAKEQMDALQSWFDDIWKRSESVNPEGVPAPDGAGAALGEMRWYFRVAETGETWESGRLEDIAAAIRSTPGTDRLTRASAGELREWRQDIERRCVQKHLRDLQCPMRENGVLVCWMEVC